MPKQDISTIKGWVVRGWKPLVNQVINWLDSFWHKDEKIPTNAVWVNANTSLENYLSTFPTSEQMGSIADLIAPQIVEVTADFIWLLPAAKLWEGVVIESGEEVVLTFSAGAESIDFEVTANAPEMHRVDRFFSAATNFSVTGINGYTKLIFFKK